MKNNFIKKIIIKTNNKLNSELSKLVSKDIIENISFDSELIESWLNWFNNNINEIAIKTKSGISIYELEFPFVEYLHKPGFLTTFPDFENIICSGGFCTTVMSNKDGSINNCLIFIDSITKSRLTEEEYNFFKFHEIGHCYYEHLFNSNIIGVLDDINLEYEADAFAKYALMILNKSFKFNIIKNVNISLMVIREYYTTLLQKFNKKMNKKLKFYFNSFIFLNKLFVAINLIKRNIKLR